MRRRIWSPTDRLEPTAADLIRAELRRLDSRIVDLKRVADQHARRQELLQALAVGQSD